MKKLLTILVETLLITLSIDFDIVIKINLCMFKKNPNDGLNVKKNYYLCSAKMRVRGVAQPG